MMHRKYVSIALLLCCLNACKKGSDPAPTPTAPAKMVSVKNMTIDVVPFTSMVYNVSPTANILVRFSEPVTQATVTSAVSLKDASGASIPVTTTLQNGDSNLLVKPAAALPFLAKYNFKI